MALPDLMDLVMHDPRRLVSLRAVAGEAGQPLPDVETLWRKPVFHVETADKAQSGKLSLEDLIDTRRGMTVVDGGSGPQAIDVPFTSLVILTSEQMPGAAEFARFVADRIEQRFRDSIDPAAGVSVHVDASQTGAAPFAVYLGHGVHGPDPERMAHGAVLARHPDDPDGTPPLIGGATPGGLHARQSRYAFSRTELLTAAVHPDLPAGTTFMLGRFPVDAGAQNADGLPPLIAIPQTGDARAQSIQIEPEPAPSEGVDIRYRVSGVSQQVGRSAIGVVDVALDTRPCRLRAKPSTAGPSLAVVGLAIPEQFGPGTVARWWAERSGGGRLLSSAMLARRDALVVQGRDVRVYDRREMRYARRPEAGVSVERIAFDGRRRTVLTLADRAFGYVAVPRDRTAISFGTDRSLQPFGALDWVGEAITVQFGSGLVARLDALYGQDLAGFMAASGDNVFVQSSGDIWLLDGAKASQAGSTEIAPGARFALGPLLIEVRGRAS